MIWQYCSKLSVYSFIYISIYIPIYQSIYIPIYLSIYLSTWSCRLIWQYCSKLYRTGISSDCECDQTGIAQELDHSNLSNIEFSLQSLKIFTFRVKLNDSMFSYRQINLTLKVNLSKPFTLKILFKLLRNCKET